MGFLTLGIFPRKTKPYVEPIWSPGLFKKGATATERPPRTLPEGWMRCTSWILMIDIWVIDWITLVLSYIILYYILYYLIFWYLYIYIYACLSTVSLGLSVYESLCNCLSICPPARAVRWKKKTWPLWRRRPRQFACHRPKNRKTYRKTRPFGLHNDEFSVLMNPDVLNRAMESPQTRRFFGHAKVEASPWRILPALPSLRTSYGCVWK